MANTPGCLGQLLAIPQSIIGGPKLIENKRAIPPIPRTTNQTDRPVLSRIHKSASQCVATITKDDSAAAWAVAEELVELVRRNWSLAERLAEARRLVKQNDGNALARQQTDIEMELVGADAAQLRSLKMAQKALDSRRKLTIKLESDILTMAGRLAQSAEEIDAFVLKIQDEIGSEDVLHQVRAYQQSANAAIDIYVKTKEELDAL
ncbi:MAG: hypothetical protein HN348_33755 [Proteobacteria bacterium]|nr:hypothetical protein [Pseudomonadota bacterium]